MKDGISVFTTGKVRGFVIFKQEKNYVKIYVRLMNVPEGKHGFHIHNKGDLRNGCKSLGGHYNPHKKQHGDIKDNNKHAGDLGNVKANKDKIVRTIIKTKQFKVRDIIGRSVVIHSKPDDLGRGGNGESKKTGNAGKRIGCGIIGVL